MCEVSRSDSRPGCAVADEAVAGERGVMVEIFCLAVGLPELAVRDVSLQELTQKHQNDSHHLSVCE